MTCGGIEVQTTDGQWVYATGPVQVGTMWRPAEHIWETVGTWHRCRRCSAIREAVQ